MSGPLATQGQLMRSRGGGTGFLNQLAVPASVIYSLKRLGNASSAAIRVRRPSDNDELNIGFTGAAVGSPLNVARLLKFAGSESAFVSKWFDQSGLGIPLEQPIAASQPMIVNAGSYLGIAKWDGTNDAMRALQVPLSQNAMGLFIDGVVPTANATPQIVVEASADWNTNTYAWIFYSYLNRWEAGMNSGSTSLRRVHAYADLELDSRKIMALLMRRTLPADTSIQAWSGGVSRSRTVVEISAQTGNFTTRDLYVGARAGASLHNPCEIFTIALMDGNVSGIRPSIEGIMAL